MAIRSVSLIIKGKVQGVWFRYFTQKEAEKLGLNGYVQNQEDGSVLIKASGSKEVIAQLLQWCKEGSPLSRVDQVDIQKSEKIYNKAFHIK